MLNELFDMVIVFWVKLDADSGLHVHTVGAYQLVSNMAK